MALKIIGLDLLISPTTSLRAVPFILCAPDFLTFQILGKAIFFPALEALGIFFPSSHNLHLLFNFSNLTLSPFIFYLKCCFLREGIHKLMPEKVICNMLLVFCVKTHLNLKYLFIRVLPPIPLPDSKFYENSKF